MIKFFSLLLNYRAFLVFTLAISPTYLQANSIENFIAEQIQELITQKNSRGLLPAHRFNYDLTLVGFVNFADGIGRHPILFKQCLLAHVNMNFINTSYRLFTMEYGNSRKSPKIN